MSKVQAVPSCHAKKVTTPTLKMTGQISALEIRSKRVTVALTTAIHTSIPVLSSSGTYQTQITFSPIAVNKEEIVKSAYGLLVLCRAKKKKKNCKQTTSATFQLLNKKKSWLQLSPQPFIHPF